MIIYSRKRTMMAQCNAVPLSYIQLPTVSADSLCRLTAWTDIPFHTAEVNGFAVLMDNDPLNNGYKLIPDSKRWVGQNVYINNNIYQWDLPTQYRNDLNNVFAPKQQILQAGGTNWAWNQQTASVSISSFFLNCNQDRTKNMTYAFWHQGSLIGSPVCGNNVIYMCRTQENCYSLTGSPVCGDNVLNMTGAYSNCYNLTGSPVCGDKVVNMAYAQSDCPNLTGSPVCGNNVTNMAQAQRYCYNLTGAPVCGNSVVNMTGAQSQCENLTGTPVCSNSVTSMDGAQASCYNLTGLPACGSNVITMYGAYGGCTNLTPCGSNNLYLLSNQLNDFSQAFHLTPILDQPTSVQIQSEAENCNGSSAFNRPLTYPSLNIYLKRNGGLAQAIANGSMTLQDEGWPATLTSRADGNGWQDTATNLQIYNNLGE